MFVGKARRVEQLKGRLWPYSRMKKDGKVKGGQTL
jgi:hypothetical protein